MAGLRFGSQKPRRSPPVSTGVNQAKSFQMNEIITQRAVSDSRINLGTNISEWPTSISGESLKNLPLAVCQVVANAKRSHIPARQKPDAHRSSNLQELRLRVASAQTQFNNFLRTTAPSFHQPTSIENLSDQRVSRPR